MIFAAPGFRYKNINLFQVIHQLLARVDMGVDGKGRGWGRWWQQVEKRNGMIRMATFRVVIMMFASTGVPTMGLINILTVSDPQHQLKVPIGTISPVTNLNDQ